MVMDGAVRELLDLLREELGPQAWSEGVKAARGGQVFRVGGDGPDELLFQVIDSKTQIAANVAIYPNDGDWSCDRCSGSGCTHAAAAAIAHAQGLAATATQSAPAESAAMPGRVASHPGGVKRLVYDLIRVPFPGGKADDFALVLSRRATAMGGSETSGGADGESIGRSLAAWKGKVLFDADDLEIDQFMLRHESSRFERGYWIRLWPLLSARRVWFQGQAAEFDGRRWGWELRGQARGGSLHLQLTRMPADEVYRNGVLRRGHVFHVAASLQDDPWGPVLAADGITLGERERDRLNNEHLPRLRQFFQMDEFLMGGAAQKRIAPRLVLSVIGGPIGQGSPAEHQVTLRSEIVYGEPAQAVFDGMHYRQVGEQRFQRLLEREEALVRDSQSLYGLDLGVPQRFTWEEANRLLEQALRNPARYASMSGSGLERFRELGSLNLNCRWDHGRSEVVIDLELPSEEGGAVESGANCGRQTLSLVEFQRSLARGSRLIDWLGGGVARLPESWTSEDSDFLDFVVKNHNAAKSPLKTNHNHDFVLNQRQPSQYDLMALNTWNHFSTTTINQNSSHQKEISSHDTNQKVWELVDAKAMADRLSHLPASFLPTLRPYQLSGVKFLLANQLLNASVLLADEMGLGKTLQAIGSIYGRTLIVSPASLLFNWHAELKRFRPELSVNLYAGKKRLVDPAIDVHLMSYGILRQDIEKISQVDWDVMVIDEAQAIKTAASETAGKIKRVPAAWRLALTGTPIENAEGDLMSIMEFLQPQFFSFSALDGVLGKGLMPSPQTLWKAVRPFYLRRTKGEVLKDLPARSDILVPLQQNDFERAAYNEELRRLHGSWRNASGGGGTLELLSMLTRLRRFACDYRVAGGLSPEAAAGAGDDGRMPVKVAYMLEHVPELSAAGHSVIIVSQWTTMLDRLSADLSNIGIRCLQLDGRTADRGSVVAQFNGKAAPVLLLSLKAGGVGLNLTVADHIFLLDPWWNFAAEEQAFSRIHRIGQENPVFTYRLISKDTIEEHVAALRNDKKRLFDEFFGDAAQLPDNAPQRQAPSSAELSELLDQAFRNQEKLV